MLPYISNLTLGTLSVGRAICASGSYVSELKEKLNFARF